MQHQENNHPRAFQAGVESRKRKREWEKQRSMLLHPPAGSLTYEQTERRRELVQNYDWLRYQEDVRRRAVEASRQGGEALRQIEERRRQACEAARHRECEIREIQERLELLKPLQFFEKSRLSNELQAAEKGLTVAKADQKRLDLAGKKLLLSCPAEVVARYQHGKEEEREKALASLLRREAAEAEVERRREEAEEAARKERLALRPAARPKNPGEWSPPSPT